MLTYFFFEGQLSKYNSKEKEVAGGRVSGVYGWVQEVGNLFDVGFVV